MSEIRTRFAPSPTGLLHLGNARTALFNWAFARRHGGRLVLRVEDTDRQRSTPEAEAGLLSLLEWLGLDWDEGPFHQSALAGRHAEAIDRLLASGRAYRCVCTREELEERKAATIAAGGKWTYDGRCRDAGHGPDCGPHTVRLRLPETGRLAWDDLVLGDSGQDASEIGDRIIRRSDGGVLYHLAVVVDDIDMRISHVIRGADHHINTAFQLALYDALEAPPPRFGHVPLLVNEQGRKLSKRRDDASVEHYRAAGFLPEAMLNWLVRMGWSHGDQEVFSAEEICRLFDLEHVGRAAAQADPKKLAHLNQLWIKRLPAEELARRVQPHLEQVAGCPVAVDASLARLLDLLRERSESLLDMAERARFALVETPPLDEKAAAKHLGAAARAPLEALLAALRADPRWDEAFLEATFEGVCSQLDGLKLGKLAQPVRVAVTGSSASPGIYETLAVLGRERSLARLEAALARIDAGR